nr:methyltransferase [uncultured Arsenicibacter sp.]
MKAVITRNAEKDGIEIKFPNKPTDDILNAIKALGFKWSKFSGVWWASYNADRWEKVHKLLGDEVEADSSYSTTERPEKAQRSAEDRSNKVDLPFLQHMKAYMQYRLLQGEEKDRYNRYKPIDVKVTTYLDNDGNVILRQSGKVEKQWPSSNEIEYNDFNKWYRVSKAGKIDELEPGKLSYGTTEVYKFGPNVYGIPSRKRGVDPANASDLRSAVFDPCTKDGRTKYISNGKQVDANVRELEALGLIVSSVKSFGRFGVSFRIPEGGKLPEKISASGESDYKPLVLPYRVMVPKQWRKPYFDLENYKEGRSSGTSYSDYNYTPPERAKLRSDLIEIEVLLGKMEVAAFKYFDAMQDMEEYIKEKELAWHIPKDGLGDYRLGYGTPYHSAKNQITWGNIYLRYTGKNAPAYLDLSAGVPQLHEQSGRSTAPIKDADPLKFAEKFITLANSLDFDSKKKKTELEKASRNTPKRNREWNSKNIEADMEADKAMYYRAIGEAIKAGTLPDVLKGITPIRKRDDLYLFIVGEKPGTGYYEAFRDSVPRFKTYRIESSGQLKSLLDQAQKIGLNSYDEIEQAYSALKEISRNQDNSGSQFMFALQQNLRAFGGANSLEKRIEHQSKLNRLIDEWRFSKQEGFFPTPKGLAEELVKTANIKPGNTVLEPSAGLGDIAEVIREMHPKAQLTVCEKWRSLREILTLKGFDVTPEDDFLKVKQKFNRIIMNPPFEQGQDIDHVRHAHSLLKPGGWVVAIVSEGCFYRQDRKATAFREWLEEIGAWDKKLPEGSFKSAFRSTGVNTRLVVIEKEGIERRTLNKAKIEKLSRIAKGLKEYKISRQLAALTKPKRKVTAVVMRLKGRVSELYAKLAGL